jgi:hypothetical protein
MTGLTWGQLRAIAAEQRVPGSAQIAGPGSALADHDSRLASVIEYEPGDGRLKIFTKAEEPGMTLAQMRQKAAAVPDTAPLEWMTRPAGMHPVITGAHRRVASQSRQWLVLDEAGGGHA